MRYHVPFAHRNKTLRVNGPVYIGFDESISIQKRKAPFNWFGFLGLLMALISPFTLFLIAPLALLFCLFGLRRSPRGMATFGLVLSVLASAALSIGIVGVASHRHVAYQARQDRIVEVRNREQIKQTMVVMEQAIDQLREFRNQHDMQVPGLNEGMDISVRHDDAWKSPLRYSTASYGCMVRSAGPDQEFETRDDLVLKLDGTPMASQTIDDLVE